MSKPVLEMTMAEIEYLLHVHEFSSERERVDSLEQFTKLRKTIDFIEERIAATPTIPCDCFYCEEIRDRKPRRAPAPEKKKEAPITFSLD
jgi:hypothetical protein